MSVNTESTVHVLHIFMQSPYKSFYYSYFIFEDAEVQRYYTLDQGHKAYKWQNLDLNSEL